MQVSKAGIFTSVKKELYWSIVIENNALPNLSSSYINSFIFKSILHAFKKSNYFSGSRLIICYVSKINDPINALYKMCYQGPFLLC